VYQDLFHIINILQTNHAKFCLFEALGNALFVNASFNILYKFLVIVRTIFHKKHKEAQSNLFIKKDEQMHKVHKIYSIKFQAAQLC